MHTVAYQGTLWELNDWVAKKLVTEGIVRNSPGEDNKHRLSFKFREEWGHKTYEAFVLAVAVIQADQAIMEGHATVESENAHDNLTDAVVILKGGRI